jgi:hypothetical protein
LLSLLALADPASVSCHGAGVDPIAFPIKVAEGKHTFADAKGRPFFWLGTTQWELFRGYELEDARIILAKTRENGFTVVQVKLLGQGDGNRANVYGHKPLLNGDALTPNEEYFKNVDAVVKAARDNNLVILMTIFHQSWRNNIPVDKARAWAKWLATRYVAAPNVIWSTTPEAKQESVPILREIAAGLREGDPLHRPISFKPDPAPAPSSSFINEEPWLDFNAMQVWKWLDKIYPMLTADYALKPVKPTVMAEGAYEAGEEYGFAVTPLWVRRQAYYSYLAGGHHTYGHNDSWRIRPTWKQALDAPGARQMGLLRKILEARSEWWLLVPDQSVFASGGRTEGDVLHLAARHQDGKWALLYLADKASFSVNLSNITAAKVNVSWLDPRTGAAVPLKQETNTGTKTFSTPDGWEDALLLLEAG